MNKPPRIFRRVHIRAHRNRHGKFAVEAETDAPDSEDRLITQIIEVVRENDKLARETEQLRIRLLALLGVVCLVALVVVARYAPDAVRWVAVVAVLAVTGVVGFGMVRIRVGDLEVDAEE